MVREEMNYEMERKAALQKTEAEKREAVYQEQNKRYRQQTLFIGLLVILLLGLAFVVYCSAILPNTNKKHCICR